MFELGAGWQDLRRQALETVPAGTFVPNISPPVISGWLKSGAFTVTSASKNGYVLSAAHHEVAAALLAEASYLLDHAAEHSATIRNQLSAGNWYSPAWLSVTFYYWSFFAAQALTRLAGEAPAWLLKGDVRNLSTLGNYSGPSPGAGPYVVQLKAPLSVSLIEVDIRKAKSSRVHDLIWRQIFSLIKSLGIISSRASAEARVFDAITASARMLGDVWPSELRNSINYAPGCGYTAVRREPQVPQFSFVSIDPSVAVETAIDRLETNVAGLSRGGLQANLSNACKILIDLTLILDEMTRHLHGEVISRRNIDRRWLNARKRFFEDRFVGYTSVDWPYAA